MLVPDCPDSYPSHAPQETEKIIAELNETWEEKLRKTEALRMERCEAQGQQLEPWKTGWGGKVRLCRGEVHR